MAIGRYIKLSEDHPPEQPTETPERPHDQPGPEGPIPEQKPPPGETIEVTEPDAA